MTIKTRVIDKGWKRILQSVKKMHKGARVKVGFMHQEGTYEDSDVTVVDVAIWNEFGTETIPERPFMRQTSQKMQPRMEQLSEKLLIKYIEGKTSIDSALDVMGLTMVSAYKNAINNWTSPPNAPATILQKARKAGRAKIESDIKRRTKKGESRESAEKSAMAGYDNPLVDTGQMMQSVTYEKEIKK
jgi:hypothetical protein